MRIALPDLLRKVCLTVAFSLALAGRAYDADGLTDIVSCLQGTAGGEAFQFGAARDSQTAADTSQLSGNVSTGAATFAFIQVITLAPRLLDPSCSQKG